MDELHSALGLLLSGQQNAESGGRYVDQLLTVDDQGADAGVAVVEEALQLGSGGGIQAAVENDQQIAFVLHTIDIHDFNTRVKNARKSLEKGDKVKASIKFKGRQISHPELGKEVLIRFSEELSDIAEIEIQPKMEGKSIYMQLTPKK